jgi:hypothetical protein
MSGAAAMSLAYYSPIGDGLQIVNPSSSTIARYPFSAPGTSSTIFQAILFYSFVSGDMPGSIELSLPELMKKHHKWRGIP